MEEKKLKPFDLEKAKAGAKVVTRDGRQVRIICWDRMDTTEHIVALVECHIDVKTVEKVFTYTNRGEYWRGEEHDLDLFMAPTTVERWVNVYKNENENEYYNGRYYDSEQEALKYKDDGNYVATTKLSWEE